MNIFRVIVVVMLFVASLSVPVVASAAPGKSGTSVTMDNFIHADSTRAYLKELAQSGNEVNVIRPNRDFPNTDTQDVIRMNSDTLYTRIILDVKGGATISTKAYKGFQNIMVLDVNHSEIATLMGAGTINVDESMLTEGQHVYVIIRTGLLRELPESEMFAKAHTAQDNISITFKSSEAYVPSIKYDFSTLDKVKYKILEEFIKNPQKDVIKNGFGTTKTRDNDAARVVIAIGWGGLSGENAVYSSFSSTKERCSITMDKPNLHFDKKAFFSFTIYNADGYIANMNYAINSDDIIFNEDGSYTINFLASGEPVLDGEKNIIRTPRGKVWTGVIRAYYPKDKNETFTWADAWTAKMTSQFMK